MATTTKKTTPKKTTRPAHSGFEAPVYGIIDNSPAKYLANGNINPAWKKSHATKKK